MRIEELIMAYATAEATYTKADVVRAPEIIMSELDERRQDLARQLARRLETLGQWIVDSGCMDLAVLEAWTGQSR